VGGGEVRKEQDGVGEAGGVRAREERGKKKRKKTLSRAYTG